MSTLAVATIKSISSATPVLQDSGGTTVGQLCRASLRFNQTGTQTINSSFNVSSITDAGTGNTTVNFANPIKNDAGTESSNYAAVLGQDGTAVNSTHCMQFIHGVPTSTQLPLIFFILTNSNARGDSGICSCAVFC